VLALAAVMSTLGVRIAARPLSFPRLLGAMVGGQLASHAVLAVSVDGGNRASVTSYHAHAPVLGWLSGTNGTTRMILIHLVVAVVAAAALRACESSLWAWFCILAMRLFASGSMVTRPLVLPDRMDVHSVTREAPRRPAFLAESDLSRRGPPVVLAVS